MPPSEKLSRTRENLRMTDNLLEEYLLLSTIVVCFACAFIDDVFSGAVRGGCCASAGRLADGFRRTMKY
jgi:hypothetical protein